MPLDKLDTVTDFEPTSVPILQKVLDGIRTNAVNIRYMNTVPTTANIRQGEIVVYDNGAGTKRIYVITGEKNLGFINLT